MHSHKYTITHTHTHTRAHAHTHSLSLTHTYTYTYTYRPSLSPFEIIDQLEAEFNLECVPMNWPIGDGEGFQGVFDRATKQVC